MTAVPFDTLKLSRKLESGGFTQDQDNTAAEALAEAMAGAELSTKGDVQDVRTELLGVRTELKSEIQAVRSDLQATKAELKAEIELSKRDMTIRLGGMLVVAVGVILAAMRFML